jgi:2-keto-4-pentenoate hydratase/2-oxohepta-3-ene-1,7-dioic acid hydratase in catechol pathway
MRLARFNAVSESTTLARLGALMSGDRMLDLRASYARMLAEAGDGQAREVAALRFPPNIVPFLQIGPPSLEAARTTLAWAEKIKNAPDRAAVGLDGEPLIFAAVDCRLHAPVRPSKVVAIGRNYAEHLKEAGVTIEAKVPSAWIKANSSIVGPTRDIVKPRFVRQLDYETELAVVIGRKCRDVSEDRAYDVIAGYTVMNDVSARDIVKIERKEGNQLLGKMFDTFCPMGPFLVTKDEVPDPMNLALRTRVNGEIRQNGRTSDMIWPIPKLIAYISQMTLEPGDVISTGTPEGVAFGRKPDQSPWWLEAGDLLESEIEGVGILRNKIVDAPESKGSWSW